MTDSSGSPPSLIVAVVLWCGTDCSSCVSCQHDAESSAPHRGTLLSQVHAGASSAVSSIVVVVYLQRGRGSSVGSIASHLPVSHAVVMVPVVDQILRHLHLGKPCQISPVFHYKLLISSPRPSIHTTYLVSPSCTRCSAIPPTHHLSDRGSVLLGLRSENWLQPEQSFRVLLPPPPSSFSPTQKIESSPPPPWDPSLRLLTSRCPGTSGQPLPFPKNLLQLPFLIIL